LKQKQQKYEDSMSIEEIKREVLRREKPSESDYRLLKEVFEYLRERGLRTFKEFNIKDAEITLVGSVAKDTWLKDDKDIDIFLLFPPTMSINELREIGLKIAKKIAPCRSEEKYAEHPYIEFTYRGVKVDIVPCFKVRKPSEVITAVDRTPFHTKYISERLTEEQRDEVRILKRFFKGIGVYGAEVKIEGFSGYLTELLILKYGSFEKVLEEVAKWRPWRVLIDIEGYYEEKSFRRQFSSPLIVIDPVDPTRNAAAAVSLQKMSELIAAAQAFLREPSLFFFYPPKPRPISCQELIKKISERGLHVVAVRFEHKYLVPDILWGELKRSLKGIHELLEREGVMVRDSTIWSNERDTSIVLFEVERIKLPSSEMHIGPLVYEREHAEKFLEKYRTSKNTYAGPFLHGDRWYVYRMRKYCDVRDIIEKNIGNIKLGKDIREAVKKKGVKIYVDSEICELLNGKEFAQELRRFLDKKPPWMVNCNEDKGY